MSNPSPSTKKYKKESGHSKSPESPTNSLKSPVSPPSRLSCSPSRSPNSPSNLTKSSSRLSKTPPSSQIYPSISLKTSPRSPKSRSPTSPNESGSVSPDTQFRLTNLRLNEYYKRQHGLAEKSRQRVSDAIAVANKYLSKPLSLPDISLREFLKICEIESATRRLKTCQRASYFVKSPELCETEEDCVQCQINRLRESLNRVYLSKRYRCDHHCYSPTMDGGGERKSPTTAPVNICRRVEILNRCSSVKTPPPAPASSPFVGNHITPESRILTGVATTASAAIGCTPDSEYDNGKLNELINRYIPRPKLIHYQCRPRTRMFLYTEKARSCNIVHHPYAVYRGKKVLTGKKKQKSSIEQSVFKVPNLGVYYTLPDINPSLGPRQTPPPTASRPPSQWSKVSVLPPIKGNRLENTDN